MLLWLCVLERFFLMETIDKTVIRSGYCWPCGKVQSYVAVPVWLSQRLSQENSNGRTESVTMEHNFSFCCSFNSPWPQNIKTTYVYSESVSITFLPLVDLLLLKRCLFSKKLTTSSFKCLLIFNSSIQTLSSPLNSVAEVVIMPTESLVSRAKTD